MIDFPFTHVSFRGAQSKRGDPIYLTRRASIRSICPQEVQADQTLPRLSLDLESLTLVFCIHRFIRQFYIISIFQRQIYDWYKTACNSFPPNNLSYLYLQIQWIPTYSQPFQHIQSYLNNIRYISNASIHFIHTHLMPFLSGQITTFHQPRFPRNPRGFPLLNHHSGANRSCEVAIIWPDSSAFHFLFPSNNTSWWLNQPIWKICSSNWIISPSFGVKIKKYLKPTKQQHLLPSTIIDPTPNFIPSRSKPVKILHFVRMNLEPQTYDCLTYPPFPP